MAATGAVQPVTALLPNLASLSAPPPPLQADYTLISTTEALSELLNIFATLPTSPPSLYVDLEGVSLSRDGSISILTVYCPLLSYSYLIDVFTLQHAAFTTVSSSANITPAVTLKSILEDANIPIVLFDVRNDNDALANLYGVRMAGVIDVQLMEVACRPPHSKKRYLNGLAKVIQEYSGLTASQWAVWDATKTAGVSLFAPEKGGSYEVFNQRPLSDELGKYCVQDVKFLEGLWSLFNNHLEKPHMSAWKRRVQAEVLRRVALCDDPYYEPKGRQRALAPAGWS